jgi:hypothetical protein
VHRSAVVETPASPKQIIDSHLHAAAPHDTHCAALTEHSVTRGSLHKISGADSAKTRAAVKVTMPAATAPTSAGYETPTAAATTIRWPFIAHNRSKFRAATNLRHFGVKLVCQAPALAHARLRDRASPSDRETIAADLPEVRPKASRQSVRARNGLPDSAPVTISGSAPALVHASCTRHAL